jgi:cupin fold WbuC family metalloprotein
MKIIDDNLINEVSGRAKESSRLRMNYNFHQSLDDKCHRFLNALEVGTEVPIHHHATEDESFIILRGAVRVNTYNDNGEVVDSVVLSHEDGRYGVDIPKNTWHNVECLQPGSVIFEVKEGPFVPHEIDGILEVSKS